ncbi:Kinesin-like protein [Pseudomonas syringae pv. actinidiae]|uniref:Kinesin-like protein n=1 Tax=Pseudomonas syringae pv. actinidiae TaxID=103796 RepID=A0AAN4Q689_PSESF|nr:Kinesin-like protein [Pseudomonas syringae pv. actinidiae]
MGSITGWHLAPQDVLQFVEQLLSAADAERRNQHRAVVFKRPVYDALELVLTNAAIFMKTITVGTFQHQYIGVLGWLWRRQKRGVARAKITGKNNAHRTPFQRVVQIAFDISRTQNMPRALQANPAVQRLAVDQTEPVIERQRDDSFVDQRKVALGLFGIMCKLNLQAVFHHQWQQMSARLAAQYRPFIARRQQLGNTPDVVVVHMSDQKRPDGLGVEPERRDLT